MAARTRSNPAKDFPQYPLRLQAVVETVAGHARRNCVINVTVGEKRSNMIARTTPAYAMTAVAGWIDAAGILLFFTTLKIFPTYMSGNTTRLFVSVAEGESRRMGLYGAAIVLFLAGAALGRWINDGTRGRESAALQLEAVLLFAAALAAAREAPETVTFGLLALAMGWNNVALQPRGGVGPRGYITGTLVAIAIGVVDALARRDTWAKVKEPAALWASLASGALAGAFATTIMPAAVVLLIPASVVALCGISVAAGWLRKGVDVSSR